MTLPGPYRTIIVEPIEVPWIQPDEQPATPVERPSEPEPDEAPTPEREPGLPARSALGSAC